jgi:hypothetical protein
LDAFAVLIRQAVASQLWWGHKTFEKAPIAFPEWI